MNNNKKDIVICMNCHGSYIKYWLEKSELVNFYNIKLIYNVHSLEDEKFKENDINLLKNADILILQYIKKDRGMINHSYIINKFKKHSSKVIVIPHYTFSGYFYDDKIKNDILEIINNENFSIKNIDNLINNKVFNENNVLNFLNNELEHIKNLDKLSDVKMYNFVKTNFKKIKLFINRAHPLNYFFYEMCNQILEIFNYNKLNIEYTNDGWHQNQIVPIYDKVKDILKLEFDTNIYLNNDIYISNNEYFYITFYNKLNFNISNDLFKNIDIKYVNTYDFINFIKYDDLNKILKIIR